MSKPDLRLEAEPLQSPGKVMFLPIAPMEAGDPEMAKIILRLSITNSEPKKKKNGERGKTLEIKGISFSFPGSDEPSREMRGVTAYLVNERRSARIEPQDTIEWSNGVVPLGVQSKGGVSHDTILAKAGDRDFEADNRIFLRAPVPRKIRVSVHCAGFADPATETWDLVPVTRTFLFPFSAEDLGMNEYFVTSARHWSNGGLDGNEIFAHDIGVEGGELMSPVWSRLLPGRDGHDNGDYRIFEMPVRALAKGTVTEFRDDTAENLMVGQFPPESHDSNFVKLQVDGTGEIVTYKHVREGSVRKALRALDLDPDSLPVSVNAGKTIGKVGNNGHSTNPHLHIECSDAGGALFPMAFKDAWVFDRNAFPPPNRDSAWFELDGHGISERDVAIWPSAKRPNPIF
jgi:murein DD-endopeptidase MepM/ murein hydrolase activator NlpD